MNDGSKHETVLPLMVMPEMPLQLQPLVPLTALPVTWLPLTMLTLTLLLPVLLSLKLQPSTMTSLPVKWPSFWRAGPSTQGRRWHRRKCCWR